MKNTMIETGVDKLVKLVEERKRVSVADAAKELRVLVPVIEEWAEFLEEEGLLGIEYKLATTYLVVRKLTKKDIEKKEADFQKHKDLFVRKVKTALVNLDQETISLDEIKERFEELKQKMESRASHVKDELEQLEKYDDIKKNIDAEMAKQEELFHQKILELHKVVEREQRRFKDVISGISGEEKRLNETKLKMATLQEQEKILKNKLDQYRDLIDKIKEEVNSDDKTINVSQDHVTNLTKQATEIEQKIQAKKETITQLITESKEHEEKVLDIQKAIIRKLKEKKDFLTRDMSKTTDIAQEFNAFLAKKSAMEQTIAKIDKERDALRKELKELTKRALLFDISSRSTTVSEHIKGLEQKLEEFNKKRNNLSRTLEKLVSLVRKK